MLLDVSTIFCLCKVASLQLIFLDTFLSIMMASFRFVAQLVLVLAYFKANTAAFTTRSKGSANDGAIRTSVGSKNGLVLGPVARNGLAFEDVVVGQGRRVLPGDTVACYYSGSFKKGAFGSPTVFDQISTFESSTTSFCAN